MKKIILLLFTPLTLAANVDITDVIKDKEHYLNNEVLINDFDSEIGVNADRVYTGNDQNLFSLSYHFSPDYSDFRKVQAFEAQYHFKLSNDQKTWLGFLLKVDQNKFEAITNNSTSASRTTTSTNDYDLARAADTKMTLMTAGFGAGYRFKLLPDLFKTKKTFEKIMVFFNYMTMNDEEYSFDYDGFGLTADYSLLIRNGKYLVYGLKLSYNIGALKKKNTIAGVSTQNRRRSVGWLATGLTFGYNF